MRILFLTFNTVGKGTYWRALYLAQALVQAGHEATVVTTAKDARWRIQTRGKTGGLTIVETPDLLRGAARSGWDGWNILRRILWANGRNFDVVHAFECRPTVLFPALYWQKRRGATLIMDWCDWFGRGGAVEERPSPLMRMLLRPFETHFEEAYRTQASGTTVINTILGRKAVALGVVAETILDLPNGCNVTDLRPMPQAEARSRLGWQDEPLVVGYIGAIFQRDARLMARAFDRVSDALPQARLLVAGYCNVDIARLSKRPEAVWQTGPIPYEQINLYLAAADLTWLPLVNSGANRGRFPLKVNDYIALGKAVVSTDVGDLGAFVRRGGFGLTADDTPEDLADQTARLLRDPERRAEMGQIGRRLAETELSWAKVAQPLIPFYERILQRKE